MKQELISFLKKNKSKLKWEVESMSGRSIDVNDGKLVRSFGVLHQQVWTTGAFPIDENILTMFFSHLHDTGNFTPSFVDVDKWNIHFFDEYQSRGDQWSI